MNICSNINYYYRQTVESNVIKKSTEITAAIAFYAFQGLKHTVMMSATMSSLVIVIPASIMVASLSAIGFGLNFVSRKICSVETLDDIPTSVLQQRLLKINSVAQYILSKINYALLIVALSPYIGVTIGANYIEDIATQISQIAIDKLGIPVQLSTSRKKLLSMTNLSAHAMMR